MLCQEILQAGRRVFSGLYAGLSLRVSMLAQWLIQNSGITLLMSRLQPLMFPHTFFLDSMCFEVEYEGTKAVSTEELPCLWVFHLTFLSLPLSSSGWAALCLSWLV